MVKYSSEVCALQKTEQELLDVFQRNYLQIVLYTQMEWPYFKQYAVQQVWFNPTF